MFPWTTQQNTTAYIPIHEISPQRSWKISNEVIWIFRKQMYDF